MRGAASFCGGQTDLPDMHTISNGLVALLEYSSIGLGVAATIWALLRGRSLQKPAGGLPRQMFALFATTAVLAMVPATTSERTWTDLSSPNAGTVPEPREGMGFGVSNGKLYVFGGLGESGYFNDLHEYDIASRTWTDLSSPNAGTVPEPRYDMRFGVSNGKLYVFGGWSDYAPEGLNDLHEYDIPSRTWTDLSSPDAGTAPGWGEVFGISNNKLYVFGFSFEGSFEGYDYYYFYDSFESNLHEYDIASRTWTDLSSNTAPDFLRCMEVDVSNGKLYVVGHIYASGIGANATNLYEYDIASRTWNSPWTNSTVSDSNTLPEAGCGGFAQAVANGKLYTFGDIWGGGRYGLHEYDLASGTETWSDLSSPNAGTVPEPRANMGFEISNSKLYVYGGGIYEWRSSNGDIFGYRYLNDLYELVLFPFVASDSVAGPECVEHRTWTELFEQEKPYGRMRTGGLGRLMWENKFEAWACVFNTTCVISNGPQPTAEMGVKLAGSDGVAGTSDDIAWADWMCYVFDEESKNWLPWGFNSELNLFPTSVVPGK